MKAILKKIALTLLPDSVLKIIKKRHYLRTLQKVTVNSEPEMKVIQFLVHPGDSVLDIGANIGVYTKFLSDLVGAQGCVNNFEPVPHTFEILKSNVENLKLTNVRLNHCAVSDENSTVQMEIPSYQSGGENYYESHIVKNTEPHSAKTVSVQSRTLDSMYKQFPKKISFIKCDVEGYELFCLKGASNFIREHKPAWFVEIGSDPDDPSTNAYKTFELYRSYGYEPFLYDGKTFQRRLKGQRSINYFFLTLEQLDSLKVWAYQSGIVFKI
jgi:FkbM family methyltransferase